MAKTTFIISMHKVDSDERKYVVKFFENEEGKMLRKLTDNKSEAMKFDTVCAAMDAIAVFRVAAADRDEDKWRMNIVEYTESLPESSYKHLSDALADVNSLWDVLLDKLTECDVFIATRKPGEEGEVVGPFTRRAIALLKDAVDNAMSAGLASINAYWYGDEEEGNGKEED